MKLNSQEFLRSHGLQERRPKPAAESKSEGETKIKICSKPMFILFILQSSLDFFAFAWVGLVLKWPIVFGEKKHSHPHETHEFYIWGPNNYLNIGMTAFPIDMFEPLFLSLFVYKSSSRFRSLTLSYILSSYSALCVLLIGGAAAMSIPLSLSQYPPRVRPLSPPSAPFNDESSIVSEEVELPHDKIFDTSSLIVYYIISACLSLLKIISYVNNYPHIILFQSIS